MEFPTQRTNVNLKDKWRTIQKQLEREHREKGVLNVIHIDGSEIEETKSKKLRYITDQRQDTNVTNVKRNLCFDMLPNTETSLSESTNRSFRKKRTAFK